MLNAIKKIDITDQDLIIYKDAMMYWPSFIKEIKYLSKEELLKMFKIEIDRGKRQYILERLKSRYLKLISKELSIEIKEFCKKRTT